jgi:hypothetical protein
MLGLRVVTDNTDVASDILVASVLDVVRDRQHFGATSPSLVTTRASPTPLKFEERLNGPRSDASIESGLSRRLDARI